MRTLMSFAVQLSRAVLVQCETLRGRGCESTASNHQQDIKGYSSEIKVYHGQYSHCRTQTALLSIGSSVTNLLELHSTSKMLFTFPPSIGPVILTR